MSLKIIPLFDVPQEKLKSLKSLKLFAQYYKAYYKEDYQDFSFAIEEDREVLGYVLCANLHEELTTPDGGVKIVLLKTLSSVEEKVFYRFILDYLMSLTKHKLIIKDTLSNSGLSILGEILFNQRFESRLTFEMDIKFVEFSQEIFYSSIRRRYKPFINWGRRELTTEFVNKDNLDRKRFDDFQKFHHKISGRITRSQDTWDAQYHMLEEGLGELILSTYKGQLAAGSIFSDYGDTSIYSTGVYERELFDFGISHVMMFYGVFRSCQRLQTHKFSFGCFDTDIKDSKWYNIQFFKKGFCKDLTPVIFWSKEVKYE